MARAAWACHAGVTSNAASPALRMLPHSTSTLGTVVRLSPAKSSRTATCGVTTSVRDTLGGQVGAGLDVAPLGLALVVGALVIALRVGPATIRVVRPLLVVGVAAEWFFELHRFHVV
jgi:hypothetical protein